MIKVVYVCSGNAFEAYLTHCLKMLNSQSLISLNSVSVDDFCSMKLDPRSTIIYRGRKNDKADEIFLSHKGKKILFDLHESDDQYPHFAEYGFPRIKNVASHSTVKSQNVVLTTTFYIDTTSRPSLANREIDVSFTMNKSWKYSANLFRGLRLLRKRKVCDFGRCDMSKLLNTRISVHSPDQYKVKPRAVMSMYAGAMLFAHMSIKRFKLLPNEDIVEFDDFVSFGKDITAILDYLLSNPKVVLEIARNGQKKFQKGYCVDRFSKRLLNVLETV